MNRTTRTFGATLALALVATFASGCLRAVAIGEKS